MFFVSGIIGQITHDLYEFLLQLQTQMNKVIKSVGKIDHSLYPFFMWSKNILKNHFRLFFGQRYMISPVVTQTNMSSQCLHLQYEQHLTELPKRFVKLINYVRSNLSLPTPL
jgi:hypothetical protein